MSRRPNDWQDGPPSAETLRWMIALGETVRTLAAFYEVKPAKVQARLDELGIDPDARADYWRSDVMGARS